MDKEVTNKNARSAGASCVRFTAEEYQRIEADAEIFGKSIPTLLKEKYFNGPRVLPLLAKKDLEKLFGELGRVGNNLNQIARRINSGIRAGFAGEFEDVQRSFNEIWLFFSSKYCRCSATARA